jgi:pimeloyl-ACP methyl ester carboxylesterase
VPRYAPHTLNQVSKHFFSTVKNGNQHGKSLMFWKWTKRIGLGLVGTLGAIAVSGALYQAIATKLDERRYPPIGEMVDIGGYHLHIHCTGSGGPTVVLDAGMGCNSLEWALVQPEIAKFTRVCSFDRAGNGWSEESPLKRTSLNIVEELHILLHKADVPGPYILVGHSFGGLDARLFASKYPDEVAGVVLVDSGHEDQFEKIAPPPEMYPTATMLFTHLGLTRLVTHSQAHKKALEMFPEEIQQMSLAHVRTGKFMRTVLQESSSLIESTMQLKKDGGLLHDKPLIVISAGKTMESEGTGYTREQIDEMMKSFKELQKDLITKSTKGKQIIAEHSDHMIPLHQPEIIVHAVKELIEQNK